MLIPILLTLAGLVALVAGGEWLVKGAVAISERSGLSPLVVGVVVIGMGTSMPELVTSIEAVIADAPAIAWGNVVGSNIANGLMILGVAALVAPIALPGGGFLRDPLVGMAAAYILLFVALGGVGHVGIGIAMLAAMLAYLAFVLRREKPVVGEEAANDALTGEFARTGWTRPILVTLGGLAVLIAGGQLLITGAIELASLVGFSQTTIGVTVVAIGTSFPELVTAVVAARRGQPEMGFGNVAGSNVFNILFIGGATMTIAPQALPPDLLPVDMFALIASATLLAIFAFFPRRISRRSAVLSLVLYGAYLAYRVNTG